MKWFKHDADANMDAKLQEVLLDYGLEGYGLYWYCIELIAGKISADNLTFSLEHDCRIIARNTGCTVQRAAEMMTRFVDLGLFENKDGLISCLKLAKRLDKSMTSNPEMRGMINQMKVKNNDYSGYVYFVIATSGNESKIKIGRSKNPTSRLAELKVRPDCEGWNLSVMVKIKSEDCVSLETAMHRKFKEINIVNEWFLPSLELMEYIESLRHDVNNFNSDYVMQDKTRLEENKDLSPIGSVSQSVKKVDNCPHEQIANLYMEILPELPRVAKLTDKRKKSLGAAWRSDIKCQNLEFWEGYFKTISQSNFLMGRTSTWMAGFDFVINQNNMIKIIEGAYE